FSAKGLGYCQMPLQGIIVVFGKVLINSEKHQYKLISLTIHLYVKY
ncbi:MAG: hypothetical protein FD167_4668, partial [bacterium]